MRYISYIVRTKEIHANMIILLLFKYNIIVKVYNFVQKVVNVLIEISKQIVTHIHTVCYSAFQLTPPGTFL